MTKTNYQIRLVIAGDQLLFQEGLRLILSGDESFKIVGQTTNELQAIDLIGKLKPDIALLDINSFEFGGVKIIFKIQQKSPKTKVLLFSTFEDEAIIVKALKAGAKGYLSKDTDILGLIKAIKMVYNNELWVERKLIPRFIDSDNINNLSKEGRQKVKNDKFTPREKDVLNHLMNGSTNKEIANNLYISEKTVKSHLNRIFSKLNVSGRLEAVLYAVRSGLA